MINKILTAISQKLDSVFGSDYEIHVNKLKQGFKEPCFFILMLQGNQKQEIDTLYFREQLFDIHYYPQSKNGIVREINEVANTLLIALEYIETDEGIIAGTKMKYELQDDVLHFFVNYNIHVRKQEEKDPYMEELKILRRSNTNGK